MQNYIINLKKLRTELTKPVNYFLSTSDENILLNDFLGKKIIMEYHGHIYCIQCGRKTSKSFQQGFCYPCYKRMLDCNLCTIYPERCKFHEGTCQSDDWVHSHCGQPHIIYLANSSNLKVGITRETQVPTRWIDQGASQAVAIMKVQNRYHSGLVESRLKEYVADRTHWQQMLKAVNDPIDLLAQRHKIFELSLQALAELSKNIGHEAIIWLDDLKVVDITYPILEYPKKIKAFDFEKNHQIEGTLMGIKGQYLLLDTGVVNIRKFSGYQISVDFGN